MARYMVTQCGFNDVVGPMFFADEGKGLSEETRRKVGPSVGSGGVRMVAVGCGW